MRTMLRPTVHFLCGLIFGFLSVAALAADQHTLDTTYRLSAGDKLRITVYGHEDLSGEFEVDATGHVSLPLIGDIEAVGKTANGLEIAITDALQPDFLKNPRVSAELLNYRPFYIFGEVNSPGGYPYTSGMTIISAVAVAGGFTYRARKNRIRIIRGSKDDQIELEGKDDTPILPGDVIEVPERFF